MKKFARIFAVVMLFVAVLAVASCAPKDGAAAKEKMDGKGYTTVVDTSVQPAAYKLLFGVNVNAVVTATKQVENKDGEKETIAVYAVLFADKADAKASISKMKEEAKKNGENTEVKQAGKWLYYGDAKAMKDFA